MSNKLELGEILFEEDAYGHISIIQADRYIELSAKFLIAIFDDDEHVKVDEDADTITFLDQVTYKAIGWNGTDGTLTIIAELIEDKRELESRELAGES